MISCPNNCDSVVIPIYNSTLMRCENCSHVFANMTIEEDKLKEIYSENYFKGEEYSDYLSDKAMLQKNFKKRLRYISRYSPKMTSVLELGCAYGFFAELIRTLPGLHYSGYDIVPEAIAYAKEKLQLNVFCEDYLIAKAPSTFYTDVFMWDVIEHLPQPELFIQKAAKESAVGGRIYITTGDISRFVPRLRKAKWRMIHPPSHLHYFTKKSITKLLNDNDYSVESITYPSVSRSIRLIFYSLFILRKKPRKFIHNIYNKIPEKASVSINMFDIMFVVAKKIK